jgi:hypothetical protein
VLTFQKNLLLPSSGQFKGSRFLEHTVPMYQTACVASVKTVILILNCLLVADSQMQTQATVLIQLEEIREIFKMMEMMISIVKSWHSVSHE